MVKLNVPYDKKKRLFDNAKCKVRWNVEDSNGFENKYIMYVKVE